MALCFLVFISSDFSAMFSTADYRLILEMFSFITQPYLALSPVYLTIPSQYPNCILKADTPQKFVLGPTIFSSHSGPFLLSISSILMVLITFKWWWHPYFYLIPDFSYKLQTPHIHLLLGCSTKISSSVCPQLISPSSNLSI